MRAEQWRRRPPAAQGRADTRWSQPWRRPCDRRACVTNHASQTLRFLHDVRAGRSGYTRTCGGKGSRARGLRQSVQEKEKARSTVHARKLPGGWNRLLEPPAARFQGGSKRPGTLGALQHRRLSTNDRECHATPASARKRGAAQCRAALAVCAFRNSPAPRAFGETPPSAAAVGAPRARSGSTPLWPPGAAKRLEPPACRSRATWRRVRATALRAAQPGTATRASCFGWGCSGCFTARPTS